MAQAQALGESAGSCMRDALAQERLARPLLGAELLRQHSAPVQVAVVGLQQQREQQDQQREQQDQQRQADASLFDSWLNGPSLDRQQLQHAQQQWQRVQAQQVALAQQHAQLRGLQLRQVRTAPAAAPPPHLPFSQLQAAPYASDALAPLERQPLAATADSGDWLDWVTGK